MCVQVPAHAQTPPQGPNMLSALTNNPVYPLRGIVVTSSYHGPLKYINSHFADRSRAVAWRRPALACHACVPRAPRARATAARAGCLVLLSLSGPRTNLQLSPNLHLPGSSQFWHTRVFAETLVPALGGVSTDDRAPCPPPGKDADKQSE